MFYNFIILQRVVQVLESTYRKVKTKFSCLIGFLFALFYSITVRIDGRYNWIKKKFLHICSNDKGIKQTSRGKLF